MYVNNGDELPFNATSGHGMMVWLNRSMTLKIRPPAGFKGRKRVVCTGIPPQITLSIGDVTERGLFGACEITTPELEGGKEYDLTILLDPAERVSCQMIGGPA